MRLKAAGLACLPSFREVWKGLLFFALIHLLIPAYRMEAVAQSTTFNIRSFEIEGNTLLPGKDILDLLKPFQGTGKTAQDVEKARDALEKMYHDKGYPAVIVNIPEQSTVGGKIHLQIIESKIGKVRITGNNWYTHEKIMGDLPSLAPGKVLYVPAVQKDLEHINRGPDFKASPVLAPGLEPGTTDVEIKVQDELPLHGNLEINDRNTLHTKDLRLNAMLRYDNLWQRDHSISVQFQTSPQDTGQVKMYALSYTLPAPWAPDHQIALYGVKSDSNTTVFGQGLLINGRGTILGLRYVVPLAPYAAYAHNITLGVDFKDFKDSTGYLLPGTPGFKTPINYVPLSVSYNASLPDAWGVTRFSSGMNGSLRGLGSDQETFQEAHYEAGANYIYFTGGVERSQKMPAGMNMFLKLDGQVADQPLIFHEQYIGGGMMNVRGYREASALGDDAVHGTAELIAPDIGRFLPAGMRIQCTPYAFYDFAWLTIAKPLPSQVDMSRLQGTGVGLRGTSRKNMYYEIDYAVPFGYTSQLKQYKQRVYFKMGAQF
jgi:hemolysin activation/secretion protein